jgi:hypothetical protein
MSKADSDHNDHHSRAKRGQGSIPASPTNQRQATTTKSVNRQTKAVWAKVDLSSASRGCQMISKIIIRLLTPIIVEVIRELLSKLANGELVSIDESSVKAAMNQREESIQAQLKSVQWEVGL